MDGISVVIADDHDTVRLGLGKIIEAAEELHFAGVASDGRAALDLIRARRPSVALVDLQMSPISGWEVLAEVQASPGLDTKIVFFSGKENVGIVQKALRMGAAGFIAKSLGCENLERLLIDVNRGNRVVSSDLQSALNERLHGARTDTLSARELEVLERMAEGEDGKEIARTLLVSEATVRTHQGSIRKKLAASTAGGAVATALRRGLIE